MAEQTTAPQDVDPRLTPKEKLRSQAWGAALEDVLSQLRVYRRTEDYFSGHSLAEAITERIDIIGSVGEPTGEVLGVRTMQAELAFIRSQGLAAIDAAIADAEG